ncbi:glycoside hydrolase family 36 protein [Kitasatospora sp. NPDC028055]|uniref:glycoside hydrolase family 36 protein n=1 Tax=Kitasatospora sp. NPDC028055 TaxID=3155653 RepID=UPI0033D25834
MTETETDTGTGTGTGTGSEAEATTEVWEPHAPAPGALHPLLHAGGPELRASGTATAREVADGVVEVTAEGPAEVRIEWRVPCVDVSSFWTPEPRGTGWLPAAWSAPRRTGLAAGAPIAALVGTGDTAVCAFAAEQTEVLAGAGVVEETGDFRFWAQATGRITVRIDTSRRQFARCLADLTAWWGEGRTVVVPEDARRPAYSTWYSMHQEVSPERIETQAALGKALGLDVIIVDDGWMTADRTRGYAHCGDWEPVSLPDTAEHVRRVHDLGVRYLLWYALPFIGKDSAAYRKIGRHALADVPHLGAVVADPRYPEVREFLTDRLARAVEEWGMDGLKVDFVDSFARAAERPDAPVPGPEADCAEVAEGVAKLLAAIRARTTAVHPEAMIEHRQPYVSPALWPYVTMIRATDCPLSPQENRQRTLDVRLAAGPVPVHADMLMWHPAEPPEQIACHLVNVLFAVPQISVDLAAQGPGQREAIAFWLGVFREHLDTLQRGELLPSRPDLGYPLVTARGEGAVVVARYAALPVDVSADDWHTLLVANADADPDVRLIGGSGRATATVQDARGRIVRQDEIDLDWTDTLAVPRGGLLSLRRP